MVTSRPPPKIVRSPPPSSSSSPPPPSTSGAPAQPMSKFPRFRREGMTTTTGAPSNNAASVNSAAPAVPRPGVGRTIPTTAGGRLPIRRRPSPSPPPPNAAAPTLEGSNQAPAAPTGEPLSRSGFALRREGLGLPQQPQAAGPGWKRRRAIMAEDAAAAASAVAASSGSQETPEAKRQQLKRVEKAESATAPKSTPQASVAASVDASVPASAVEEQRGNNASSAPAGDESKASAPPLSTDPSSVLQQQDKVSDLSDLPTPLPEESDPAADPQVPKAAASALAISDVGGKSIAVEDPMSVDPVTLDGSGGSSSSEQATYVDDDDAHDSAFVALIKRHAEMICSSSLWISGALQSIRDDISKAATSNAGRAKLGELVRLSVTDFFEPAAERTKVIGQSTDAFVEEMERYRGEGKLDKEVPA